MNEERVLGGYVEMRAAPLSAESFDLDHVYHAAKNIDFSSVEPTYEWHFILFIFTHLIWAVNLVVSSRSDSNASQTNL